MSVKSDDIGNTHVAQLLKSQSTVQGLSLRASVLAAFVEEGHDHIDSVGFSGSGGNDPFQVLIVVVRGHMVLVAADGVGETVIGNIHHNIQVCTADRLPDIPLAFPGAKTGTGAFDQERLFTVPLRDDA